MRKIFILLGITAAVFSCTKPTVPDYYFDSET